MRADFPSCRFDLPSQADFANGLLISFRTLAPLQQPPHIVALASLYATSLLLVGPVEADRLRQQDTGLGEADRVLRELVDEMTRGRREFEDDTTWEHELLATLADLDGNFETDQITGLPSPDVELSCGMIEVVHNTLDMYITIISSLTLGGDASSTPLASPHSPSDPTTSMTSATTANQHQNRYLIPSFSLPSYWTTSTLTQLKIQLHHSRAEGIGGRPKIDLTTPIDMTFGSGISDGAGLDGKKDAWLSLIEGLGKNEGTVRFVFG